MDINPEVELDTSQVSDDRDSGGYGGGYDSGGAGFGPRVAIGGGGVSILGLVIYLVLTQLGGGSLPAGLSGEPSSQASGGSSDGGYRNGGHIAEYCQTGQDVATHPDCEVVPLVNSIQAYWTTEFAQSGRRYVPAVTHVFSQQEQTGCGPATSDIGPFYCPADKNVYIDLSFYAELQDRFGAQNSLFARAYVLAHEYGHHVQDLLGRSTGGSATGATSGSVRLELQADCYAGVWAKHAQALTAASGKPYFENISPRDVAAAVDTAGRIGDDYIQSKIAHRQVDSGQFTHGTSAQREKWLTTGLQTGDPATCNTFARGVNLG